MRRASPISALALSIVFAPAVLAAPYALIKGPKGVEKASLFSAEKAALPIAQVGARTVTLSELTAAISALHQARGEVKETASRKKDFTAILDRLIGVRLIVQEAQAMGLDELEEFKNELAKFEETSLREELQQIVLRGSRPDQAEVKKIYRFAIREWKLRSALFEKEDDAKALIESVKAGKNFDEEIEQAVAQKKATGGAEPAWFSRKLGMLPQIVAAVEKLGKGEVSAPVRVDKGFAVMRVEDVRHPDNRAALIEARKIALAKKQKEILKANYERLLKKYARIDRKLLETLDFESKEPGFAALSKDPRVLASIAGGTDIKVSDLAAGVQSAFFHGVSQAASSKRINSQMPEIFDSLVSKQIVSLEVARRKLLQSAAHKRAIAERRDALLFAAFLERAIVPDVKVTEADLKSYYDSHQEEFTYPELYSMQSLAFVTREAAQAAFDKLKAGTDFKWLASNADGQVPAGRRALELDGTLSVRGMEPVLAKAVAGAKAGDQRLFENQGQHFLVLIRQVTPSSLEPYAETRNAIAPKVQQQLVNKALEEWIKKLRAAHQVKVFITRIVS